MLCIPHMLIGNGTDGEPNAINLLCHPNCLFHEAVTNMLAPYCLTKFLIGKPTFFGGSSNILKSYAETFLLPDGFNSGCFYLHMSQNVATSIPILTSQSCSDSLLAVYLVGQVGAIYRPPKHPWMPDRPVNEASVKVDL